MKMWPGSIWAVTASLVAGLTVSAEARPPETAAQSDEAAARAKNLPPIAYRYKPDPNAIPQTEKLAPRRASGGRPARIPARTST